MRLSLSKKMFIFVVSASSALTICVLQELSGIELLISENKQSVFLYQNDIIMNWKYYKNEYGAVKRFDVKYCTYWSGLETHRPASTDVSRENGGRNCPAIIFPR